MATDHTDQPHPTTTLPSDTDEGNTGTCEDAPCCGCCGYELFTPEPDYDEYDYDFTYGDDDDDD